jgi:phosphoglycolate phosphatase-like HAD superfamily hydrolase
MQQWMRQLAKEYRRVRKKSPDQRIMIVFDIDGTILDNRYVVDFVLKAYDRSHLTHFFDSLELASIDFHEDDPHPVFERCGVPEAEREKIFQWYREHRWQRPYLLAAHRPYQGVLEVIRWFSIQPNTFVGLNTGRPEPLREDTLRSLNELGKEFRVHFSSDRLFMGKGGWGKDIMAGKVQGLRHFEQ